MRLRHCKNVSVLSLAASLWAVSSFTALGQTQNRTGDSGRTFLQEPLGKITQPKMSLFVLALPPGGTHTTTGGMYVYVLEGEVENQLESGALERYRRGEFFHAPSVAGQRILRNRNNTEAKKIIVLQNTPTVPQGAKLLLQQPLTNLSDQEIVVATIVTSPEVGLRGSHQHPGSIFAYLLKGEVVSQIDPGEPETYHAGDAFYEAPMHAHRVYTNLSKTDVADLLIFQVREKGKPFAMGVGN